MTEKEIRKNEWMDELQIPKLRMPIKRGFVVFHNPKMEVPEEGKPLLLALRSGEYICYKMATYHITACKEIACYYHDMAGVQPFMGNEPFFISWAYLSDLDEFANI